LPEPLANYISEPDLSAVAGVPSMYWIITGDVVTEMSQGEKTAVDDALLSDSRDATVEVVEDVEAFDRQIVQLLIRELNILRALHGLPDRTLAQVKAQMRSGLGS